MVNKTHRILIAGGSGLVGHDVIKSARAAGHFVIALVRRGGSLSVEGLTSDDALQIIEVDFDALDQYRLDQRHGDGPRDRRPGRAWWR